ncbi:hypothetical protein U9M48_011655 [Paspalum notatum var. saurae]|uniref:BHLH domain-containing protein n=1 Tax=Paspalum notatum var. saurae TaxID=547442 RepID=A0AAQ3WHQ4_PASNO
MSTPLPPPLDPSPPYKCSYASSTTTARLLLYSSLPSIVHTPRPNEAAHGFLRSLEPETKLASDSDRSVAGTSCRALLYDKRYLGVSGPKKWLPAMDGGQRPAASQQKIPFPPDGGLVELLWQDGAVVAHSQAQELHHQRPFRPGGDTGASGVTGDAEAPAWLPGSGGGGSGSGALGGDVYSQLWQSIAQAAPARPRPPARSGNSGAGSSRTAAGEVGSSFCGSNLVAAALHLDDDIGDVDVVALPPPLDEPGARAGASTSSGWNSSSLLKRGRGELDSRSEVVFLILFLCTGGNALALHKFSSIGVREKETHLQDADFDTVDETRASRRPASKRRTRAAEVHNMSERRRRDRINEKMRALQELVPHCNKTDKASILDEAIEYLKSLQMQVQVMWMTTGMAPMMLPGAHHLMPPITMGLNSVGLPPAAQFLSQMQRVPPFMNNPLPPNQMPQVSPPATSAPGVTNQVQSDRMVQLRNPFLHPNDALTTTPQVPSLFGNGPQMAQVNEIQQLLAGTAAPAVGSEPPSSSDGTGT